MTRIGLDELGMTEEERRLRILRNKVKAGLASPEGIVQLPTTDQLSIRADQRVEADRVRVNQQKAGLLPATQTPPQGQAVDTGGLARTKPMMFNPQDPFAHLPPAHRDVMQWDAARRTILENAPPDAATNPLYQDMLRKASEESGAANARYNESIAQPGVTGAPPAQTEWRSPTGQTWPELVAKYRKPVYALEPSRPMVETGYGPIQPQQQGQPKDREAEYGTTGPAGATSAMPSLLTGAQKFARDKPTWDQAAARGDYKTAATTFNPYEYVDATQLPFDRRMRQDLARIRATQAYLASGRGNAESGYRVMMDVMKRYLSNRVNPTEFAQAHATASLAASKEQHELQRKESEETVLQRQAEAERVRTETKAAKTEVAYKKELEAAETEADNWRAVYETYNKAMTDSAGKPEIVGGKAALFAVRVGNDMKNWERPWIRFMAQDSFNNLSRAEKIVENIKNRSTQSGATTQPGGATTQPAAGSIFGEQHGTESILGQTGQPGGTPPPFPADPAQRQVGQVYTTPGGKVGRWNGTHLEVQTQ